MKEPKNIDELLKKDEESWDKNGEHANDPKNMEQGETVTISIRINPFLLNEIKSLAGDIPYQKYLKNVLIRHVIERKNNRDVFSKIEQDIIEKTTALIHVEIENFKKEFKKKA